jgi:antitoxin (DNA-binding transcriptional repressor) of toxin-antitoxin stability system
MRSVTAAALRKALNKHLALAKAGEEVVICERGLPIAKLVPFFADDASEEDLRLVAEGKMRLPTVHLDVAAFLQIPTGRVRGNRATEVLIEDRGGR